ncbi:Zinc-regulated transporter [Wickerhamomyces ciferrii]|uniref:Zinc-regulated transporter n=1 Tax=Wickerhamomyces ciferrii (strain ATCC 14091 / BCRC 22168 / CBS 111 / JCM 3599 / NBRC 0793 / NRRL Y-1031 F-60-10) TaxID=1206466 RepID=K0KST0_WICCF|nr:Zinc-regulated transporter [Wickerhamomyces ciferrii]CCH46216.1 Zinc-regulated transporter [Wickerhamomyces ciferrii]
MLLSFEEWIKDLFTNHQGWFLTALSSLMCIFGAAVIYLDLLVRVFNKRSKFDIKSNEKFLICGFSLSSGSLLFTSFYKLLPKALEYFQNALNEQEESSSHKHGDGLKPSLSLLIYFLVGVFTCEILNYFIHRFTSKSIIHCNHSGESDEESVDDHSHSGHSHSHGGHGGHGHEHHEHEHEHEHGHSHSTSSDDDDGDDKRSHDNHDHTTSFHVDEESLIANDIPQQFNYGSNDLSNPLVVHETTIIQPTETSSPHKQRPSLITQKRKSFFDLALGKLKKQNSCIGIDDEDCEGVENCISDELTNNVSNDLHNLNFYRGLNISKSRQSIVAYTSNPSSTGLNQTYQQHQHQLQQHPHQHQPFDIEATSNTDENLLEQAKLIPVNPPTNIRLSTEANLDNHQKHKDDHHHQVTTPISKLLAIGLQTCLALTLHKFPEGFITFATSKADPKLGISIFLSLAIHNIVEGFSMTLPLYLAFNSRFKAFTITFLLGGFSQPVGAAIAYLALSGKDIDKNASFYVFGILMSITSGFLSVISLQLFASSINFGGHTNTVIKWCLVGVVIIQISSTLTEYSS